MSALECPSLASDLIEGAENIAVELFGDPRRSKWVYRRYEEKRRGGSAFPVFKLGAHLCARRSVILAWIQAEEQGAAAMAPEVPATAARPPAPSINPQRQRRAPGPR